MATELVENYSSSDLNNTIRKTLTPSRLSSYLDESTPYTTPTLTPAVPLKVLIPTTVKKQTDFTLDVPNTRWFLDSAGTVDREFTITMTTSMTTSLNNTNVTIYMYKNGVKEPGIIISRKVGTGADRGAISVTGAFMLSDTDYIEVFVQTDLGGTVTFEGTAINILEVN